MNKLGRKLLSGFLVLALGITSTGISAFANETNELNWEVIEDLVTKNNKFTPEKDETIKENEEVRALIVFEGDSVIDKGYDANSVATNWFAKNYVNKLEKQQDEVLDNISNEVLDGEEIEVRNRFTVMANAVSTDITYGEVLDIRDVDGVVDVYVLPQYEPQTADKNTSTSGDMVGSYNVWESGYTGAGMRIAIIDTGLDIDHPSFDADAYLYALEEQATLEGKTVADYDLLDVEEIASVVDQLYVSKFKGDRTSEELAALFYHNEKTPFVFNYVDDSLDGTHDNDSQGDHGTHVSGIATANKYVPQADGTYAPQENGVVGIAPNAQIFVMKVFGANGGAYTDDYMTAIQDALLLGADSINLSLGSGNPGDSSEYDATEAYVNTIMDGLAETDTVVAFSAGNSYMWADFSYFGALLPEDVMMQTDGSPGSYKNSFTVASAENTGFTGHVFNANGVNVAYTESNDYGNAPFVTLDTNGEGTEYEYVFINGIGVAEDYEGLDVTGKIVFVSRGSTSFYEKANIAVEHGAIASVIYNNTAGSFGMNLTGYSYTNPSVSISLEDAIKIVANSEQITDNAAIGTITVYSKIQTLKNVYENAFMSDFSSWGVPGDLTLKPEITAPGGNIWSTYTDGQYGNMSGTSMASPSIAGMSALVIEYIEKNGLVEKTGLSARELAMGLLMATSNPLTQDETYYSPRKQGAGLANVYAATTTPVYISMREDGKVKAELGDDPERTGKYEIKFTLYNLTEEVEYYTIDVTALTEELTQGFIIGNSYKLDPKVEVEGTKYLLDIDQDGDVDKVDALIFLQHVNETLVNDYLVANENLFDLNENGTLDTNDVHIYLTLIEEGNVGDAVVEVKDEAEVTVTITLSDADKEYLDTNYANGMYVDGYVQLDGDIDLVVPFLAFYGNWADASMFEHVDFLSDDPYQYSYSGTYNTNEFVDEEGYVLGGNNYAEDDEYLPERNAINSNTTVFNRAVFTLIRNSADTRIVVTDKNTDDVYFNGSLGYIPSEYYYVNGQQWKNTTIDVAGIKYTFTDANGVNLPENTEINLSVTALPSYYLGNDSSVGKGTTFTVPFTIDNTAPVIKEVINNGNGTITVKYQDNQYVAAVQVYDRFKEILHLDSPNQIEKGIENEYVIEIDQEIIDNKILYVAVVDYAGNATTISVNLTGLTSEVAEKVEIRANNEIVTNKDVYVNVYREIDLDPYILPEYIVEELADDVTWKIEDETVAAINENGVVTGLTLGTTKVTVTTAALDKDGNQLTAECTINVVPFDAQLIGYNLNLLAGTDSISQFTAQNPSDSQAYLQIAFGQDYLASLTNYNNGFYGITVGGSLYQIAANGNVSLFGTLSGGTFTDMTHGKASGYLTCTDGTYLYFLDPVKGSLLSFELSAYTGQNISAIEFIGTSGNYEMYAIVNENSDLILFQFDPQSGNVGWSNPLLNAGGAFGTVYCSLAYDQDNEVIYYSYTDTSNFTSYIFAIDTYVMDQYVLLGTSEFGDLYYGLSYVGNYLHGDLSDTMTNHLKGLEMNTAQIETTYNSLEEITANDAVELERGGNE